MQQGLLQAALFKRQLKCRVPAPRADGMSCPLDAPLWEVSLSSARVPLPCCASSLPVLQYFVFSLGGTLGQRTWHFPGDTNLLGMKAVALFSVCRLALFSQVTFQSGFRKQASLK